MFSFDEIMMKYKKIKDTHLSFFEARQRGDPRLFFLMKACCKFFKLIIYFKTCGVTWMNRTNWYVLFLEFASLLNYFCSGKIFPALPISAFE